MIRIYEYVNRKRIHSLSLRSYNQVEKNNKVTNEQYFISWSISSHHPFAAGIYVVSGSIVCADKEKVERALALDSAHPDGLPDSDMCWLPYLEQGPEPFWALGSPYVKGFALIS